MRMMLYEILNDHATRYEDEIVGKYMISGETVEECFRKAYDQERSIRYCFGRRVQFKERGLQKEYERWRQHGVTIEMFYGSATVD